MWRGSESPGNPTKKQLSLAFVGGVRFFTLPVGVLGFLASVESILAHTRCMVAVTLNASCCAEVPTHSDFYLYLSVTSVSLQCVWGGGGEREREREGERERERGKERAECRGLNHREARREEPCGGRNTAVRSQLCGESASIFLFLLILIIFFSSLTRRKGQEPWPREKTN